MGARYYNGFGNTLRQAKIIVDSPISYCESRPVIHLAIVLSQLSFTIQFPNSSCRSRSTTRLTVALATVAHTRARLNQVQPAPSLTLSHWEHFSQPQSTSARLR